MTKDWLIRTKNNHILGPVTKDKIKQLISNGSIKGDDEVCSGNGYWVFIREQDLIARFIFGDEGQGFNPVQEIDPVLTGELVHPSEGDLEYPSMDEPNGEQDEFGNLMPDGDDLEYPDMDNLDSQMDSTVVNLNLKDINQEEEQAPSDIEDSVDEQIKEINQETPTKKKIPKKRVRTSTTGITKRQSSSNIPRKRETQIKNRATSEQKKSSLTKNVLYALIFLLFIAVSLSMYFRKTLLKEFLQSSIHQVVPSAYAQVAQVSKKKSGLIKES